MQLAHRHPYTSVGAALAAVAVIAVTPASSPPLDLQHRAVQLAAAAMAVDPLTVLGEIPAALQTNFSDGLSEIFAGVTAFGAGDMLAGLNDFLTAPASLFLDPAENVYLGLADAVTGQPLTLSDFEFSPLGAAPNVVELTAIIHEQTQALMSDPSLSNFLSSLDLLFYFIPKDLFIDSLGGLAGALDPGAVATAFDPAAVTAALADLPTLLLGLIP